MVERESRRRLKDGKVLRSAKRFKRLQCQVLSALTLLVAAIAFADVKTSGLFSDNMVIQRDTQAPVWGWASPGEKVSVEASWGAKGETVAGDDGKWLLKLKTPEAGGPYTITIQGKNKIVLNNVMSGEVWLCSGQSNMQMSLNIGKRDKELAAKYLAMTNIPKIRLFKVRNVASNEPVYDPKSKWLECSPKTALNFSAVAFFFGKTLYDNLDVPIGLINASWGGTGVEAWTELEKQMDDPNSQRLKARYDKILPTYDEKAEKEKYAAAKEAWAEWQKSDKKSKQPPRPRFKHHPYKDPNYPGNLYNGMIVPVLPYAIQGAIWYQGEHNSGKPDIYQKQLERLISTWRDDWKQGDFPFYFVQLPNYRGVWKSPVQNTGWTRIREAFMKTAQTFPNTGMAVTIDVGEAKDIHPVKKLEVGDRLGRVALYKTYGKKDIVWTGPLAESCKFEGNKAIVKFENGGSPLAVKGDKLFGFALVGQDGDVVRADAEISGDDTVTVTSPKIAKPAMVYYAWAENPEGSNLINKEGLPASPFRFGTMPKVNLLAKVLPDVEKEYKLVYNLNPINAKVTDGGAKISYINDNSDKLKDVAFKTIAYFLALKDKEGKLTYAFVTLDAFTDDIKKIGVPMKATGARFQQKVTGLTVKSNVESVKNGSYPEGGNIEFWDCNYGPKNVEEIPEASSSLYDFGDQMSVKTSPGYGCMQIHNWKEKQSVICFNNMRSSRPDVGIGDWDGKSRDWTFSGSSSKYALAELKVLVK